MELEEKKELLIKSLVSEGYLKTPKVIEAFRKVKREDFIEPDFSSSAYVDTPLPIPGGQTTSAPHMYAIMLELARLKGGEKILEVGTGSGYNAALMAEMAGKKGKIISIEFDPYLTKFAKKNLEKGEYNNVIVLEGDGSKGYKKGKPYDLIIVTCATPEIYREWKDQLKTGGIILAPLGSGYWQELVLLRKTRNGLAEEKHGGCVFVPLRR